VLFWLKVLLLLATVVWSSLAVFGGYAIDMFLFVVVAAVILNKKEDPSVLLLLLGTVFLLWLLVPSLNTPRGASRRAWCCNNLLQISLALSNYESQYHCFPPAYVPDKDGKPMHSWRVLILPYLDRKDLYDSYDFNEPWDGPNNRKLLAHRPGEFACPGDESACNEGATTTSYVAVVGKNALWQADKPRSLNEPALRDTAANTVMLVEVADSGINWTEPKDFSLDDLKAGGRASSTARASLRHMSSMDQFFFQRTFVAGAYVSFADGHVVFLSAAALVSDKLQEWFTIGGYAEKEVDKVSANRFASAYVPGSEEITINWMNCFALVVWIVSVAILLYQARRSRKTESPKTTGRPEQPVSV
jgi:hypothetical protein